MPGAELPTPVLAITDIDTDEVWDRLLASETPVVARRDAGELIIDIRAVPVSDDDALAAALAAACR